MMQPSTGLPGLDKILHEIRPGDNIVWQVETIDDFLPFITPYCDYARVNGIDLIYFRFSKHKKLVTKDSAVKIYQLHPEEGFEKFITKIHNVIEKTGKGVYYIFDSLSELALDCFSERMTGNFFMLTCPLLYKYETIAYFSVIRNYNSHHAADPISKTTQVLLDIYNHKGKKYLHPLKVDKRYTSTMYMLHEWNGDDFIPVTESPVISGVATSGPWHGLQSASYRMVGLWDRRFMHAEEILESYNQGECSEEIVDQVFKKQIRQIISHDKRILELVEKYFSLSDIIHIWKRTIGSGLIGGKSVGMLLARAILKKDSSHWSEILEDHDSFYIGSDIFYTFLVENGIWEIHRKQKNPDNFLYKIEEGKDLILKGNFPGYIIKRFSDMLDYFGQSPIIVRSSSLLEDAYGNSFSGKYESVFCVNNGTREQRLNEFINAVRTIYASTMGEEALVYRAKRGVLGQDEQMALLVQRVSGGKHENLFFPQLAGVGFSYNSYVWDKDIDPEAGLLRLVFGLGTRAVERCDDDYTRIVALNAPEKRPEGNFDEVRGHSQKRVDFLDLEKNQFSCNYFIDIIENCKEIPLDMFTSIDNTQRNSAGKSEIQYRILNFNKIFSETNFIEEMHKMLNTLEKAYNIHLDIEFTVNYMHDKTYKINLLQCRPLQVITTTGTIANIPDIAGENIILKANGGIIGQSRSVIIDKIIYVVPSVYGKLPESQRYAVARLIGKLTHINKLKEETIMIIGPGRWGTSMPSLGVPVSFTEINTVSVICEIAAMHDGLTPDLSLGTHFFNEIVETNMLYMAFFTSREDNLLNNNFLLESPSLLTDLFPESSSMDSVIRIIDCKDINGNKEICLNADTAKQLGILYAKRYKK